MGFNANSEPPKGGFDMIPAGVYTVAMVDAEIKDSSSTPGNRYMNCQFKVTKGKYKGTTVYKMFHCFPAESSTFSEQEVGAVEHLLYLVGVKKLKGKGENWNPLFNKPVCAKVVIEKDKEGIHDDKNTINSRGFTDKSNAGKEEKSGTGIKDQKDAPWDKKKDKKKKKDKSKGKKKDKKKKK